MKQRTDKLIAAMPAGFEAALISTEVNRFYFLNFDSGDAGTVLILPDQTYFIIDSRYIEIANAEVKQAQVILQKNVLEQVREILESHGVKHLYMENKATVAYAERVRAALTGIEVDTSATLCNAIEAIRAIKGEEEIAAMRRAQVITDDCFDHILGYIKPGMREIDVALEMEMFMRSHGAGKLAFPTILVTGTKTSLPHGVPGENVIRDGDFITMDYGANVDGYCTDMTRTIAVGHVSDEQKKVYDTVLKAQLACCEQAKAGMRGCDVDKIARDIIYAAGYEGCFGHGLGHAVGIEIHEEPRYSPMCETVVQPGMLMTIEPGIYLEGKFGVRIEDTTIVRENGCEILGKSDKNLIIL
ncbi:M24 family metallopeptidase [uncultured Ruthenibacterium sp.]|uniref:M24 family metallopeptidase n=1 Tax=uncultured Ruthenibacterium sp. TaxID=1905347 RepID=UPI00349ED5AE